MSARTPQSPRAVGLFAGIGGIELGLEAAGFSTVLLSEVWPAAQAVLRAHLPDVELRGDVCEIDELPEADVISAGFPCQDLSQAGRTAGIGGRQSGLVSEVFRLVDRSQHRWLLLENVPFMLRLDRGNAMRYLTDELDQRGYTWAYRVVDTRAFGLPQRRKRVVLVASREFDPRPVLFADDADEPVAPDESEVACGFYWTEGIRGLGWAVDAVPTLKGGSSIGIPSPPAIRLPHGEGIALPDVRDAERMQGFEADWTLPALEHARRKGVRWKLVGNAVSVPLSTWVGERLLRPGTFDESDSRSHRGSWPDAAWGHEGRTFVVERSHFPVVTETPSLLEFLEHETAPLSERATAGFLARAARGSLRFPDGFLDDVAAHLDRVQERVAA